MNIVYNSDQYSVLAYPAQDGFELVDKEANRSLFIQGETAYRFRKAIDSIPEEDREEEVIDDFLDAYCSGMAKPITHH